MKRIRRVENLPFVRNFKLGAFQFVALKWHQACKSMQYRVMKYFSFSDVKMAGINDLDIIPSKYSKNKQEVELFAKCGLSLSLL